MTAAASNNENQAAPRTNSPMPVCIVSRYNNVPCGICSDEINAGDRIFPFPTTEANDGDAPDNDGDTTSRTSKQKAKLRWAHRDCYPNFSGGGPPPPPPPCRHWTRLGRCPSLGVGICAFRHDEADKQKLSSAANGDSADGKRRWGGRRRLVRNAHKNTVFRAFLMQHYGLDYLRGCGVLEVAGGQGELSWELINLMGVRSAVVDPRPLALQTMVSKWKKGIFEPKRTGPVFRKWFPSCEEGCSRRIPERPRHLRCFFDAERFARLSEGGNDDHHYFCENNDGMDWRQIEKWFEDELCHARRIKWTTRGLQHEDGEKHADEEDKEEDKDVQFQPPQETGCSHKGIEVTDPIAARDILQQCGLVVGFHPDQAAGDIAAYATGRRIPWCIVPCCVYSDMFPRRRLESGTMVRTHEQLVQWLCETYPQAKVATLELEGKNKVVYIRCRKQFDNINELCELDQNAAEDSAKGGDGSEG